MTYVITNNCKKTINFFLCIVSLLLVSCSQVELPSFQQLSSTQDAGFCRLAVLPFTDKTDNTEISIAIYRIFISELIKHGDFQISQEGDVRTVLRQVKMVPHVHDPTIEQIQIIGNYLNVPYLIVGKVLEAGTYKSHSNENVPYLVIEVKLVDTASGRTVWLTYHRRTGEEYRKVMHFGAIYTVSELSGFVSREIIARWATKGFRAKCTE